MEQRLLAIDPGTTLSGVVVWDGESIIHSDVVDNVILIQELIEKNTYGASYLAIENISSYGQKVGNTTFETCIWIGRFYEAWRQQHKENTIALVKRHEIKSHICPKIKSNDSKIIEALTFRFGNKGTKSKPGFTYGLKSHAWQAFALAVYCSDNNLLLA